MVISGTLASSSRTAGWHQRKTLPSAKMGEQKTKPRSDVLRLFATPGQPARLLCPWRFSRQEYWSGLPHHTLLQGIFPTQGSKPGLPHCRKSLYHLCPQGSPRILEWVAYPFSRGSSQPRNQTRVSLIVGRFFTSWTTSIFPKSTYLKYSPKWVTKRKQRNQWDV